MTRTHKRTSLANNQRGGTLLGIVIGLVIGLGIALAVALMITKSPIPFMDKAARVNRNEAATQKDFDPNKPLYTSPGNGQAARNNGVKEVDPNPPINTAAQPPAKPLPPATSTDNDPIAALANGDKSQIDKAANEKKAPAAAEEKWNYYLQAGAFREQSDAEAMRGKLALAGVEAQISERPSESGLLYRVRVGPFNQLDALNKTRAKMSDVGVDAAVVRIAK